ncbi:uncharacterized protein C8R40DRAFT_1200868 [Lentinula edodes]|uniref:uncharacterized protein n=1 Tax=Lentinula edodes TaxID=5353 RepID=UPI001E8D73B8|nr:uncharacterized protein C8R40DRAFT_1200868 [Lentinula edodes]KAH7879662.1 hypothetical protein C8R40DRAFT_1200868 [Lentinula edodes]
MPRGIEKGNGFEAVVVTAGTYWDRKGSYMLSDTTGFALRSCATEVDCRVSSNVVFPWSTWPIIATTGGRKRRVLGSGVDIESHFVVNNGIFTKLQQEERHNLMSGMGKHVKCESKASKEVAHHGHTKFLPPFLTVPSYVATALNLPESNESTYDSHTSEEVELDELEFIPDSLIEGCLFEKVWRCFVEMGFRADFAVGSPETCTGVDVGVELVREVGSTLDHLRAGRAFRRGGFNGSALNSS